MRFHCNILHILLIVPFLLIVPLLCCGASHQQNLERGYQANSQDQLIAFIDAWHADSKPIATDTLRKKPSFERDVYNIFYSFYGSDKEYDNIKYIIIQNNISVRIVDSDLREEFIAESYSEHDARLAKLKFISKIEIEDFRPNIIEADLTDKKVLYLQDKYLGCLLGFITQEKHTDKMVSGKGYMREKAGGKERENRLKYLNTVLKIIPGHSDRGWDIETQPLVQSIYLSSDSKRAIVFYKVPYYRYGEALVVKNTHKPPIHYENEWEVVAKKTLEME